MSLFGAHRPCDSSPLKELCVDASLGGGPLFLNPLQEDVARHCDDRSEKQSRELGNDARHDRCLSA